jgi:succinyl-CoA synthetase alpha subunit
MGHAGAIVVGDRGSYASKKAALETGKVAVVPTPGGLAEALLDRVNPPALVPSEN